MAYYPTFQPYGYQDQLNQLRNANPMPNPVPMQGFQMPMNRPDPDALIGSRLFSLKTRPLPDGLQERSR